MRKKKTAVWFYLEIDEIDDVDAQQYHRASLSTRNSALNTSLRKPIRIEDFIQLCDSMLKLRDWKGLTIITMLKMRGWSGLTINRT